MRAPVLGTSSCGRVLDSGRLSLTIGWVAHRHCFVEAALRGAGVMPLLPVRQQVLFVFHTKGKKWKVFFCCWDVSPVSVA